MRNNGNGAVDEVLVLIETYWNINIILTQEAGKDTKKRSK